MANTADRRSCVSGVSRQAVDFDPESARGELPTVLERRIEDDVEVGRATQPGILPDLLLELSRAPARVAERDEHVPRAAPGDERVEDVARHGDRDVLALHRERVFPRAGRGDATRSRAPS